MAFIDQLAPLMVLNLPSLAKPPSVSDLRAGSSPQPTSLRLRSFRELVRLGPVRPFVIVQSVRASTHNRCSPRASDKLGESVEVLGNPLLDTQQ
jgi:hypothetical protein